MNLVKMLTNPQEALQDMAGGKMEEMLGGIQIEPSLIISAVSNMVVTAVLQEALRRSPSEAYMAQMKEAGYTDEQAFGLWSLVLKEAVVQ